MPLNEYFYIRVRGVWGLNGDTVDTIEMPLVYGLRFITYLALQIKANTNLVKIGEELRLSVVGSEIVNLGSRD